MRKSKEGSDDKKKASDARNRIAELLLAERLSLHVEWLDPGNIAVLPQTLPQGGGRKLSPTDVKDLEKYLDGFVRSGCSLRVLYWCLERLGPQADRKRAGEVLKLIFPETPRKLIKEGAVFYEDETDIDWVSWTPALATREDMAGVITKIEAAAKAIRRFEKELVMVADALGDALPLPQGLWTDELFDADETMLILRQSLAWAKKLAASWQAPNHRLLVKSKGILYLLMYVWIHTKQSPAREGKTKRKRSRKTKPYRIARQVAHTISIIAHLYCGMSSPAEDLIDKLEDFHDDYPDLHKSMVILLESLEESTGTASLSS